MKIMKGVIMAVVAVVSVLVLGGGEKSFTSKWECNKKCSAEEKKACSYEPRGNETEDNSTDFTTFVCVDTNRNPGGFHQGDCPYQYWKGECPTYYSCDTAKGLVDKTPCFKINGLIWWVYVLIAVAGLFGLLLILGIVALVVCCFFLGRKKSEDVEADTEKGKDSSGKADPAKEGDKDDEDSEVETAREQDQTLKGDGGKTPTEKEEDKAKDEDKGKDKEDDTGKDEEKKDQDEDA